MSKISTQKMPLAISMLILLGSKDAVLDKGANPKYKTLIQCFEFKGDKISEALYGGSRSKNFSVLNKDNVKKLFNQKNEYEWDKLINYLVHLDDKCEFNYPDSIDSIEGIEKILEKLLDLGKDINQTKYEYEFCQFIATFFLENGSNHCNSNQDNIENTIDFFNKATNNKETIEVCMTFHHGTRWNENDKLLEKLNDLVTQGVNIKIIITDHEIGQDLFEHWKHKGAAIKKDYNLLRNIERWKEISESNEKIKVRFCKTPVLRRTFIIKYKDNHSIAYVRDYMYGDTNAQEGKPLKIVQSNDDDFSSYENEFNYMWENLCDFS